MTMKVEKIYDELMIRLQLAVLKRHDTKLWLDQVVRDRL